MKKHFTIFIAISMIIIFLFSGCGKKKENTQVNNETVVSDLDETTKQSNDELNSTDKVGEDKVAENSSAQSSIKTGTSSSNEVGSKTENNNSTQSATKTTTKSSSLATTKSSTQTTTKPSTQATTKAPTGLMSSFSATDINGKSYNQSMLSGKKMTVVNLWATWCGPCRNELSTLAKISSHYASKGVQIVGVLWIDQSSTVSEAKTIASAAGANYTQLVNQGDMKKIVKSANGNSDSYSFPTTFCVDANGKKVGKTVQGAMSESGWKNYIDNCLKDVS